MADLYTSLSRAKQILMATRDWRGDGPPPPPVSMTPVPESVRHIIRPEYTIGLGALRECGVVEEEGRKAPCPECRSIDGCEQRGLQCPICGEWFDRLSLHLNKGHKDVGGAVAVHRALQIPTSAKLASHRFKAEHRAKAERMKRDGRLKNIADNPRRQTGRATKKMVQAASSARASMGVKNLRNACDAQIKQRLAAIYERVGRSPTLNEAAAIDQGAVSAAQRIYGSWNNAKAQLGWDVFERHAWRRGKVDWEREAVVEALSAWYEEHGALPRSTDAQKPNRTPLIPAPATIIRAMGGGTWVSAMDRAADTLGIYGGRYGSGARKAAA